MPLAAAEPRAGQSPGRRGRRWRRVGMLLLLATWACVGLYHASSALPPGVRTASPWSDVPARNLRFLHDTTSADAYGRPIVEQQIFDEAFALIGRAQRFIVLDYFLFNDQRGALAPDAPLRPLAQELEQALLARKQAVPGLQVLFITDPINDVYGGDPSPALERLRHAGISVVVVDLDSLPDSNPIYSGLWRLAVRWWSGDDRGQGWLPNPLETGPEAVTFRAWARLLNLKADHRKVLIADDGAGGLAGLVGSANPHAASSAHSNVALELEGPALLPLLESEIAVARNSGWVDSLWRAPPAPGRAPEAAQRDFLEGRTVHVRVLTEGAIRDALLERIAASARGESIDVAMFYLSEREVIEALLAAAARGVAVRVLLDPNKDAFGHEKSGIPNRQVAAELVAASDGAIKLRWYRTHGEQFHTKLVVIRARDRTWFTLGSANLTRRNIGDFNLEANLAVECAHGPSVAEDVQRYFETLWSNQAAAGIEYSASYDLYSDPSQGRYWLYRLMEATGLSTF